MSSTTTTTTTTATPPTLSLLADYELHHSTPSPFPESQSQSQTQSQTANPPTWPTDHRRIPPYRPINRSLDFNERSAGSSVPEYIFIQVMLHGVWINASIAQLWRATGGRINERIFRHDVGGEY
ncbi:uncharacterized protein DSM5745_04008 [Aspergillus mulundensis]|uniref:Uncharacterized protein n=1 Tax=Aspergillus mulundensis TaxID=1810919 RepID=A0A3D8SBE9_9EURO|nr:Uncharacterized protein DSM5745_04008 [Aspergillus mulundensis]RDW83682.1 Uncharacterized protein DSM5745_04008 [Aspergillus mulundensis]